MYASISSITSVLLVVAGAAQAGENWPSWRGPNSNGVSPETKLPEKWSNDQGVRWKVKTSGHGTSSPIVWGDRIFLTAADGPRQTDLHVFCLSTLDGRQRWHQRVWGTSPTLSHGSKSDMATPTPVTDGKYVYAFFGTGDVFCLDMEGRLQWHRSLASEYGPFENRFGHTSSPLLFEGMLVVECDHYGDSYLLALDGEAGTSRWRIDRRGTWHSWSSPQLFQGQGAAVPELIVCAAERVDSFELRTGYPLWTVRGLQRECIPTPVTGHGMVFAVSGPNGATFAIRPGGHGDVTESHVAWTNQRGAPFVPSAILVGDNYYLVDDRGIATCLDALSGDSLWQKRLGGAFTASPIAGDGKVYFANEDGETIVIKADEKTYHELARNSLSEPIYASGAISQGCIFLRTPQHLFCIDGK